MIYFKTSVGLRESTTQTTSCFFRRVIVSGMAAGMRGRLIKEKLDAQRDHLDFNHAGLIGASDKASSSSQGVLPLVYVETGFDQSTSHHQRISNPTNSGMNEQASTSDTMLGSRRAVPRMGFTETDFDETERGKNTEFSEILKPVLEYLTTGFTFRFQDHSHEKLLERTLTLCEEFSKKLRRTDPQPRDPFYTDSMEWIFDIVIHVSCIDPKKKHELWDFCSQKNALGVESYITDNKEPKSDRNSLERLVDDLITENSNIHFDKFQRDIFAHAQRDGQSSHSSETFQEWLVFREHQKTLASILTDIPRKNPPNYSREGVAKKWEVDMIGEAAKKLLSTITERHLELGNIKPFSSYVEKIKADARMAHGVDWFEIVARELLTPLKVWRDVLLSRRIEFPLQPFERIYLFLDEELRKGQHEQFVLLNWLVILDFYVKLTNQLKPLLSDDAQMSIETEIMNWLRMEKTVFPNTALGAREQHNLRLRPIDTPTLRWIGNQLTSPLCEFFLNNMSALKIDTPSQAHVLKSPQTGNLVRGGLQPLPHENSHQSLYGIPKKTISTIYSASNTVPISNPRPGIVKGSSQGTNHGPAQLQWPNAAYLPASPKSTGSSVEARKKVVRGFAKTGIQGTVKHTLRNNEIQGGKYITDLGDKISQDIYPNFKSLPRSSQSLNLGKSSKIESISPVPRSTSKMPISNVGQEGVNGDPPTNILIPGRVKKLVTNHIPVTGGKSVKERPFAPGVPEGTSPQSLITQGPKSLAGDTKERVPGTSRALPPQVKRLKSFRNPVSSDPPLKSLQKHKSVLVTNPVQLDGSSAAAETITNSPKQSEKGKAPSGETGTPSNAPGVDVRSYQMGSPINSLESTETVLKQFEMGNFEE
ncbi:hypothetical protein CROQUDRAFT_697171 [Cronartium quercuum f. sp. fusiforme G11]|uniref:Uncharacterized protein n=1 Tax=Cronartium quercuum f. sp. fusiforme G11 TaxID=708437 RepID=A0A9P6NQM2_9BASI|nr:hypothetical protein CROQUDRAFT_697171 [Cronartium quercuum f. sp. fusiforme G11]